MLRKKLRLLRKLPIKNPELMLKKLKQKRKPNAKMLKRSQLIQPFKLRLIRKRKPLRRPKPLLSKKLRLRPPKMLLKQKRPLRKKLPRMLPKHKLILWLIREKPFSEQKLIKKKNLPQLLLQ